jgi:hypothetical protein
MCAASPFRVIVAHSRVTGMDSGHDAETAARSVVASLAALAPRPCSQKPCSHAFKLLLPLRSSSSPRTNASKHVKVKGAVCQGAIPTCYSFGVIETLTDCSASSANRERRLGLSNAFNTCALVLPMARSDPRIPAPLSTSMARRASLPAVSAFDNTSSA